MMKCVECEHHEYMQIINTHFCNHKGKSGKRKPRRISETDVHKDVFCSLVEEERKIND